MLPRALGDLASHFKLRLQGQADFLIRGVTSLDVGGPGLLAFVKDQLPGAITRSLSQTTAEALVIHESAINQRELESLLASKQILFSKTPYETFLDIVEYLHPPADKWTGIDPSARIDPSAVLGEGVAIGAFCSIGPRVRIGAGVILHSGVAIYADATIGDRTVLHSGVAVRERCTLGSDCIVHNNTVIGADGFGYIPDPKRGLRKVPHVGCVRIGHAVEIGANTSIDRGAFGDTVIGNGTKIDNLVQIGHNCTIGSFAIICGQVGIAGSCTVGDGVVLGGNAGLADHVSITAGCRLAAKSGVTSDLTVKGDYAGYPAVPVGDWRRQMSALRNLPKQRKKSPRAGEEPPR